jgi:chromosome segregation ATPase
MATVPQLQAELAAKQAELDTVQAALAAARNEIDSLRSSNATLQAENTALQVDKDRFTAFEAMQVEHDKNLIRIEAMKRYLADKDATIEQLGGDIANERAVAAQEKQRAKEKEKEARGFERQLLKAQQSMRGKEIERLHLRLYQTRQKLTEARLQIQQLQS